MNLDWRGGRARIGFRHESRIGRAATHKQHRSNNDKQATPQAHGEADDFGVGAAIARGGPAARAALVNTAGIAVVVVHVRDSLDCILIVKRARAHAGLQGVPDHGRVRFLLQSAALTVGGIVDEQCKHAQHAVTVRSGTGNAVRLDGIARTGAQTNKGRRGGEVPAMWR